MKNIINFGTIHETQNGIIQVFFNHKLLEKPYRKSCSSTLEAECILSDFLFDFYSENSFLLPKGIHISKSKRAYSYEITINGKNKHIFFSKNLEDVFNKRIEFINSLLF